jgi:hyperosmotically inducible protein
MPTLQQLTIAACLGFPVAAGCAASRAQERATDAMHTQAADFKHQKEEQWAAARAADRHGRAVTADNQGSGTQDIDITRSIRQALMHDDDLSLAAKNIAVITQDGTVTLKGLVASDAEKAAIHRHTQAVAGVRRIEDLVRVR